MACASGGEDNSSPSLDPIDDQQTSVGAELTLELSGRDADGDSLTFAFTPDSSEIRKRAGIAKTSATTATFTWVPASTDVGIHAFDFSVSDGVAKARRSIVIDVRAEGGDGAPQFVKPLGKGTVLDIATDACISVPVEVIDPDSTEVELSVEPPLIGGGAFVKEGPYTARWDWCPSAAQLGETDLFNLVLGAFDGTHAKVLFDYLILVKKGGQSLCPGAPVIDHVAADETTSGPIDLEATISDDVGLAYPPQLFYATSDPGPTPALGDLEQVTMQQVSGDLQSGVWRATLPNPVAGKSAGSTAPIFYVILAGDESSSASCTGQTQSPPTGTHSMVVTADSGGSCSALNAFECGADNKFCDTSGGSATCQPCPSGTANCNGQYACECDGACDNGKCVKSCSISTSNDCGNHTTFCDSSGNVNTCKNCPAGTYNCNGIVGCECTGVGCDGSTCLKPCSTTVANDCGASNKYCDGSSSPAVCRTCPAGKYNCNGTFTCECSSTCSGSSCG